MKIEQTKKLVSVIAIALMIFLAASSMVHGSGLPFQNRRAPPNYVLKLAAHLEP